MKSVQNTLRSFSYSKSKGLFLKMSCSFLFHFIGVNGVAYLHCY